MASEIVIPEDKHEIIDHSLCQAQAIITCARHGVLINPGAAQDALWAADELIERARELIGKF